MSDSYSVFRRRMEQAHAERAVIAAARAAAVRIPDFPNAIGYCPSCHSPVDFCDEQRAAEGRRCVGGDLRDALAAYDALHSDPCDMAGPTGTRTGERAGHLGAVGDRGGEDPTPPAAPPLEDSGTGRPRSDS